jgi:hypothetical protein
VVQAPPYRSYATIMGAFFGLVGLTAARGRDTGLRTPLDLAVLAAATFRAAHTLTHDEVTSFLREPFVRGHAHSGDEEPKHGGMEQAIGELVTCSRCAGTWAAALLVSTRVVAPRFGKVVSWTLAVGGLNDFLQAGFAALTNRA